MKFMQLAFLFFVMIFFMASVTVYSIDASSRTMTPFSESLIENFKRTSQDFINDLESYHKTYNRFASAEGKGRFEDIGLKNNEWDHQEFAGVVYEPRGDKLLVRPAGGYTFFVDQPDSQTRILDHKLGWDLIYSLKDQQWYFGDIDPAEKINIETIFIKKDTPYNPAEYKDYRQK